MALITCGECGKEVSDKAPACNGCGAPLGRGGSVGGSPQQTQVVVGIPKSRSLTILLAVFLGGIGIHKFYLNQPGMGVLYLLFCWTFIPMIIGFIEALQYLFMSDEKFQKSLE